MKFKTLKELRQIGAINPKLFELLQVANELAQTLYKKDLVVTSVLRNGGIHSTGNATDVGLNSGGFTTEEFQNIANILNNEYTYDPERPEYKVFLFMNIVKKEDGTEELQHTDHGHCQVHDNSTGFMGIILN